MDKQCPEEFEILMSGYLDDELDEPARIRFEAMLEADPACRREFDVMKRLVLGTGRALALEEPPEEVWDTFLDSVYNRLERRTGWIILMLGMIILTAWSAALYFVLPWAPPAVKVLLALPVAGLVILFISVLRQRLRALKTDRYTKEVMR
jgi:anti-sigma factor RsiW